MTAPTKKIPAKAHARQENRPAMIAKVHVAKKQLNMTDNDYRAMLVAITGKDSTKELTMWELDNVIQRMISLGFKPRKTTHDRVQAHDRQSKKIRALWLELNKAGLANDPNESALAAYVKRQTGVEALQWLSTEQASKVIEAMKKWLGKAANDL